MGGTYLPIPTKFVEAIGANESTNQTLDGTLYVDYTSGSRTWTIEWAVLCEDDYNSLREIYDNQYVNNQPATLVIPYYDIDVLVEVNISSKNIFWDGNMIKGFSITLVEIAGIG